MKILNKNFLMVFLFPFLFINPLKAEMTKNEMEIELRKLKEKVSQLEKSDNFSISKELNKIDFFGTVFIEANLYDEKKPKGSNFLNNEAEVSRARFGLTYDFTDNLSLYYEHSFAKNKERLYAAYIDYEPIDNFTIQVGKVFPLFTLENTKSSSRMSTIAFSYFLDNFVPADTYLGINFLKGFDNFSIYGAILEAKSEDNNEEVIDDSGYRITSRFVYAPIKTKDTVLHLGLGAMYSNLNSSYIDVGNSDSLNLKSILNYNVEFAFNYKNFNLQSEYLRTIRKITEDSGKNKNLESDSYYVEVFTYLTGEVPSYDMQYGIFGGIKVLNPINKGGYGAFQLVARYSYLDTVDDYTNSLGKVSFGTENKETLIGLNWYLIDNFRILFNASRIIEKEKLTSEKIDYYRYTLSLQTRF